MPPRFSIHHHRLNSVQAELWISADAEDFHGRLVGPLSEYSSTIEVAYALQPLPRSTSVPVRPTKRVLIPEPSLWSPQTPFLYRVEIEQAGEQVKFNHGLRTLEMRPQGCRLNGQPIAFDAITASPTQHSRAEGANALLIPSAGLSESLAWADRFGWFVFAAVEPTDNASVVPTQQHASLAGWLLEHDVQDTPLFQELRARGDQHLGIEVDALPLPPLPTWANFIACSKELAANLADVPLPKVIVRPTT